MLRPVVTRGYRAGFMQAAQDTVLNIHSDWNICENVDLVDYRNEYAAGYQDCFCQYIADIEDLQKFAQFILYFLYPWAAIDNPIDAEAPQLSDVL